ncbi:MAG TPA: efflux RND transporter periplasmic adaptor subunit [Candidatus Krumholzibacteria bacterium]|nr:efflux RND transporter periplasmic adaptor subunit [Candidatus Krumholzibacteria bacterium]
MNSVLRATRNAAWLTPFLVLGLLAGCQHKPETHASSSAPVAVQSEVVEAGPMARTVEAGGSLHGAREAVLAAKVMASIREIRKLAGEPVKKGDVLIVLDDREVAGNIGQAEGALAQAEAAASLAESNYKRYQLLFERGSASQLELDQARFAHESAQGAVKQARAATQTADSYQSYALIPAPFDGRVVDRMAEVGDLAAPGHPLMRVEDARRLRLHVSLSENETGTATVGDSVRVDVPSVPGRTWTGTVAEVVPAVDPATRTTLVKIDLPEDAALRSGMFARARFTVGKRDALRVPRSSVVERGGMDGVFLVEDGKASFRLVQLAGDGVGEHVEVLSGLRPGDRVILAPAATLAEGSAVEVQP